VLISQAIPIYFLVGASAGILAGLLGVGGGLIMVPALAYLYIEFGFDDAIIMQLAVGTSLATIVVTALSSTLSHHKKAAVLWSVFMRLAPAICIGVSLGAYLAVNISSYTLKQVFGVFEMLIALQMIVSINKSGHPGGQQIHSSQTGHIFAGLGIGTISALIGIGGGTFTVPYLTWQRVGIRQAVATSAACGLPIAIMGCISYIVLGLNQSHLPQYATGFVYWPSVLIMGVSSVIMAPVGVHLAHRIPTKALKSVFALLLVVVGAWMVMD